MSQKTGACGIEQLIEIERPAINGAEFGAQGEDVGDAFQRPHEVGAGGKIERSFRGAEEQIAAHPAGQIEDDVAALIPDPRVELAKERNIATRLAGIRVANVQVDDGGASTMGFEGRCSDLCGRYRHMRRLAGGIARPGDGAGNEYSVIHWNTPLEALSCSSVQSAFDSASQ